MKMSLAILASSIVLSAVGCTDSSGGGGIGGVGGGTAYTPSNSELTSMITNSVNRNVARPMGYEAQGWRQKDPSAKPDWYVMGMSMNTPYSGSYFPNASSYSYIAINTRAWDDAARARNMSLSTFVDRYFANDIYLSASESNQMYRGVSYSGGGYYSDEFGNLYDEAGTTQKDLETLAALQSEAAVRATGEKLAAEFSLSEEQSFRIARIATEWQTISKSRQMTAKDLEAFTKDMVGLDLSDLRTAAQRAAEGDSSRMEGLINKASQNLDTTPENVKAILATFIAK